MRLLEEMRELGSDDAKQSEDDTPLTDEEILELTTVIPTDPEEVIAMGLIGTMPHLPDGLTWVTERKKEHAERLKRKFSRE